MYKHDVGKYNKTFECHDVCVYVPVFFMPIIGVRLDVQGFEYRMVFLLVCAWWYNGMVCVCVCAHMCLCVSE